MVTKVDEEKQKRHEILVRQREMINRAKKENRELNPKEELEYRELELQLMEAEERVGKAVYEFNKELAEAENPTKNYIRFHPDGSREYVKVNGGGSSKSTGQEWRDVRTGELLHVLTPQEKMSDFVSQPFSDGIQARDLDFGRWVRGVVTGNWKGAEAEARAMNSANGVSGGYLVPTALSTQIIDLARAGSAAVTLGAGTLPMDTQTLSIARAAGDPTPVWHAESSNITPSDPTFEQVTLTARTLAVLTWASIELIEDSPNAGEVISNAIAKSIAGEMDRVALYGNGTGQEPCGIINNNLTQTYSMGANGATMANFDPISESMVKILNYNGNATGALFSPRTWKTIDQLKENSTNAPLQPPPSFQGLQKLVSSRVSIARTQGSNSTCSDIFVADWSQLLFGIRTQLNLEVSREAGNAFSQLTVGFRGYARLDLLLRLPKHFCTVVGVY